MDKKIDLQKIATLTLKVFMVCFISLVMTISHNCAASASEKFNQSIYFLLLFNNNEDNNVPSELFTSLEMHPVPGGTYIMGEDSGYDDDDGPEHPVSISPFYMMKKVLTRQQLVVIINIALKKGYVIYSNGDIVLASDESIKLCDMYRGFFYTGNSIQSYDNWGGNWPAHGITWYGAALISNFLSEWAGKSKVYNTDNWEINRSANGYRLPYAGEWEYVAKVGDNQFEYGTSTGELRDAQYNDLYTFNIDKDVASYPANPFGFYDLMGAVNQWLNDWWTAGDHNPSLDNPYYVWCLSQGVVIDPSGPSYEDARIHPGYGERQKLMRGTKTGDWPQNYNNRIGSPYKEDNDGATGVRLVLPKTN